VPTIMLEIPSDLKPVVEPILALIVAASDQLARCRGGQRADYERFEGEVAERTGAIERAVHQAALAALDVDAPVVKIDGVDHSRVGRHEASYHTRAGVVRVMRSLYRPSGSRGTPAVNAVSLRARTVEDEWLPGVARQMAHLLQQGTSREAEVTASRLGLLPYSRSSFERIGHAVGSRYVERAPAIAEQVMQTLELPKGAAGVSVSMDRVSLAMEEPLPRPVGRPRKDAPTRPVARVYRMAYCGTVTIHDAEGESLRTLRYGTMPAGDAEALAMHMAGDVLELRSKQRNLSVSILCDGAPEMWNLLDAEIHGPAFGVVTRTLDFWHATEKLAPAAEALCPDAGADVLARWKHLLLHRVNGAAQILNELVDSGRRETRRSRHRPIRDAITYLQNNADRMGYARARRRGLPIGSGNVEATCKSLIAARMKRSGSRWKTTTGEEILKLRALSLSDTWEDSMDLLLGGPQIRVRAAA